MPTYPRHPLAMAHQALSTQAAAAGRLALGVGPSHPVVIEAMHGLAYEAPARHTREYVEVLRAAFACTGHVEFHGEFFDFSSMLDVPGATPAPILVAALAPLMLKLAGEVADGTITYWANERALTEHIVPRITRAAATAGRPRPVSSWAFPSACVTTPLPGASGGAPLPHTTRSPPISASWRRAGMRRPRTSRSSGRNRRFGRVCGGYADAGATDLCAAPLGLDADHAALAHPHPRRPHVAGDRSSAGCDVNGRPRASRIRGCRPRS